MWIHVFIIQLCICLYFLQIIFRFALALFKYKEEEFLKLQDSTAIFKFLRHFTRTILDSSFGPATLSSWSCYFIIMRLS